uniref:O antigen biosynthesis rhamnosyltransferase rfbN (EC) n=1 Tax=uncultured Thiotrichaceae bacterium TaxID=298394 RepID=A0A6S6SVS8_9GAMM|nr:MAG: O antigen biosynthesis rhamnosyltransferase rfbN (EC [uncultured Thiotrichaceae bacterium]
MTIIRNRPDVAVVVLTRNAGELWASWIQGVKRQSVKAGRYLVIDSSSSDGTAEQAISAGFDVFGIDPKDFNHGGTRQLATELCPDAKFIVYMTQDAILEQADSLQQLLSAMEDETVAMSYGRHVPHESAGLLESHARSFTYPAVSSSRSRDDFEKLGFRAAFSSDVYACYRVSALRSVGGFPEKVIVSEDSYVTACLLLAGWRTVYSAQSEVRHSHRYSLLQVFRRYFDVGVFHVNEAALLEGIGKPDKEAGVYVRSLISYLYQRRKVLLPFAAVQTFVKLIGFRLGKRYADLPNWLCSVISLQKSYWQRGQSTVTFGWQSLDVNELLSDDLPVNVRNGVLSVTETAAQKARRVDLSV